MGNGVDSHKAASRASTDFSLLARHRVLFVLDVIYGLQTSELSRLLLFFFLYPSLFLTLHPCDTPPHTLLFRSGT